MTEFLPFLAKLNSYLNAIATTHIGTGAWRDFLYSFAMFGMTQQQKGMLEQHIGTVLQVMVVGLLAWSLNTSVALRTEVSVLQSQMTILQASITSNSADFYRASAAVREFAATWEAINRVSSRVSATEDAIQKHRVESGTSGRYVK